MFDNLLIHPRTRTQLMQFVKKPSHGLILCGTEGSGKKTVAIELAAMVLNIENNKLDKYPYYSIVDPDDQSIKIEEIRRLQQLLTLRTPEIKGQSIRRIITIVDAGRMRFEAQNAFLKSLEEPPKDTCIILTADGNKDLIDTIYSRVQRIDVLPVSETMAKDYFLNKGISSTELNRNFALSQGQVGLLSSLLDTQISQPLKESVETAKALLAKLPGERLLETDTLTKDKQAVILLINALNRICHAGLTSSAKLGNKKAIDRWTSSLEAVADSFEAMSHNANLKILIDNLLLSI